MEELMMAYDTLNEMTKTTNVLDKTTFGSFYSMLAEEWCRANDEDVTEFITEIYILVHQVNAEFGRY